MRILEVGVDLDGGGIDRYLYNYCTRIHSIHFDYSVANMRRGMLEPLLEEKGSTIYRVPRIKKNPLAYYRAMKANMKKENYDAVHIHLGYKGFLALIAARRCGIKTRIAHAHIALIPETKMQTLVRKVCTVLTKANATHLAACGVDAAKWVWGEKTYAKNRVRVINNAIETAGFAFSQEKRQKMREKLGISEDALVVGNVGRLSDQKNPLRLVEIFARIYALNPNSVLLFIGRGEMEAETAAKVRELGLADRVRFLGVRNDVADLLNTLDVLVFPSKYEGLPFALIEAQCNGLRCVCSDAITPLVKVTELLSFLSLEEPDEVWARLAIAEAGRPRSDRAALEVKNAGYDIDEEARKLEAYYRACIADMGE